MEVELVNLNKPRPKHGGLSHLIRTIELICPHGDRGNGQPVHEEIVVREVCLKVHLVTIHFDILELLDDRLVLAIEIRQTHVVGIIHSSIFYVERELDVLVLSRDRLCFHSERLETLQWDSTDVGAGTFDDKVLDGRERKVAGRCRYEGLRRRSLLLHESEEPFLFCFVSDHGGHGTDKSVVLVLGEDLVDVLQSAQDNICEGAS
jgi:hypothetical protein